jgi:formamidopyrimidine-DNA glycosylase
MPEGNTILRIARAHNRDLAGRRVAVSAVQKTFAKEARGLDGRVFERAEARGKRLFHHWRGGPIVHIHLGRFGDFYRREAPPPPPRPSVRMRLSTSEVTWDLIGPPTCEIVTREERDAILARLGPDPLSSRPDAERVFARLRRTDVPIAHALLDQRVLAGVGNIFRAEALFVDGIHPLRPASSLAPAELARLWATVRRMMRRAVRRDRTFTLEPADTPPGPRRRGARSFYVYQEDVCLRCGGRIRSFPLSGRTMYACETCQPRPSTRRSNAERTRRVQSRLSG